MLSQSSIAAGRLTPFSASDPTQGGLAFRGGASLAYEVRDRRGAAWHLSAYAVDADLRLYDNSSLFLADPDAGDALEYLDRRRYYGAHGTYRRPHALGPFAAQLLVGVTARTDAIDAQTWHTERRLRLPACFAAAAANPCTDAALRTADLAVYATESLRAGPFRLDAGVRQTQHTWSVDDRDADTMLGPGTLGGTGARARIDPKLGAAYLGRDLDIVLLAAAGHHGTDARAAVDTSTYGAFVRTYAAELGLRAHPDPRLSGALALWASHLADHQIWLPAAGASARVAATRRHGLEARLAFAPTPWLSLDAALGTARSSFASSPNAGPAADAPLTPPLAPRFAATAGLALHRPSGFVSLRLRALGVRATIDPALSASGHTLVDLVARRRLGSFELGASVENLLDSHYSESQLAAFVRPSRLVDPIRDLLVSPGAPLTLMLTLGYAP